jgi:hypothetical protein
MDASLTLLLLVVQGVESVRSVACEHWIHSYANVRVHIYSDVANGSTCANLSRLRCWQ